jgi:hypothetical protein
MKIEIVTNFLKSKGFSNIEETLKNSTAKQTSDLISSIISNEENNLQTDFFQLLSLTNR